MSGKWNPVLLSTGQHPRCGRIRWPTVSRFYAALCQTGRSAPFLARDVGSNGGFETVISDRWRSAFGRQRTIINLRHYLMASVLRGYLGAA
jgi:hypothetical protein